MAQIASKKILALPVVTDTGVTGSDAAPVVAAGITSRMTLANWALALGRFVLPVGVVVSFANWLSNNRVYNVKDAGAAGDGIADDTAIINSVVAAAIAAGGGIVYFPPGTYKTTSNLTIAITTPTIGLTLRGVFNASVIKPTVAVTIALNLGSSGTDPHVLDRFLMTGFRIDCTNMGAAATGIKVGDYTITGAVPYSTYMTFRDVDVYHATGVGSKAWWIADLVEGVFENCYAGHSTTPLHIEAHDGNMPTELAFRNFHSRSSPTGDGANIVTGDGIRFDGRCVFEANALAGLRVAPTAGQNISGLEVDGARFEGNYAGDTTKWQCHIDGTLAGTVAVRLSNIRFTGAAKSIYLKNARNSVIDKPYPSNVVDAVYIDVGVMGEMFSWPHNNLDITTRYKNLLSPTTFHYMRSEVDALRSEMDVLHADIGWSDVPTLQNSWVNYGAPYANAQFQKDALGWLHLRGLIKNGTVTPGTVLFTLIAGYRPLKQLIVPVVSNGAFTSILIDTAGAVSLASAANATYLSLEGIRFRTY